MNNNVYEELLKKVDILNNLQRVLLREKRCYLTVLHHRYGVGMTEQQFTSLMQILVERGFCTCSTGQRGGILITLNMPEESQGDQDSPSDQV
jgi:hypothetical protein